MSGVREPVNQYHTVNFPVYLSHCEVNYQRLLSLLQNVQSLPAGKVRHYIVGDYPDRESDVYLTVVEQTRYTTVVQLVQHARLHASAVCVKSHPSLVAAPAHGSSPSLRYESHVRLYHDANVAEIVKCQHYRQFSPRYTYPNVNMHQANEKMLLNSFLGELLTHCLSSGRVSEPIFKQRCR